MPATSESNMQVLSSRLSEMANQNKRRALKTDVADGAACELARRRFEEAQSLFRQGSCRRHYPDWKTRGKTMAMTR